MLNLSLTAVARGPVRLKGEIPAEDPFWSEVNLALAEPFRVDLEAGYVGQGILVRGQMETELAADCRRCLVPVPLRVRERVELLFERLSNEDEAELGGEVYPLPERGDDLDLSAALREQLLLRVPEYVLCSESCRGLCPHCGADLNGTECDCVPEAPKSTWDALKQIKFD
jgi:uncharacterized protein